MIVLADDLIANGEYERAEAVLSEASERTQSTFFSSQSSVETRDISASILLRLGICEVQKGNQEGSTRHFSQAIDEVWHPHYRGRRLSGDPESAAYGPPRAWGLLEQWPSIPKYGCVEFYETMIPRIRLSNLRREYQLFVDAEKHLKQHDLFCLSGCVADSFPLIPVVAVPKLDHTQSIGKPGVLFDLGESTLHFNVPVLDTVTSSSKLEFRAHLDGEYPTKDKANVGQDHEENVAERYETIGGSLTVNNVTADSVIVLFGAYLEKFLVLPPLSYAEVDNANLKDLKSCSVCTLRLVPGGRATSSFAMVEKFRFIRDSGPFNLVLYSIGMTESFVYHGHQYAAHGVDPR